MALVADGAGIAIVAVVLIGKRHASLLLITPVGGAAIAVIAVGRITGDAFAVDALIGICTLALAGANVVIRTWASILKVIEFAFAGFVATVFGAIFIVVAVLLRSGNAGGHALQRIAIVL